MGESAAASMWVKSTLSGDDNCLEWRVEHDCVLLRNSRDPNGVKLRLTRSEWRAFVDGAKAGQADT
jgi:hypothetical protein